MSESDLVRLRHMRDAAREAVEFGAGRWPDDLARDRVLTLALVRCIEIIGEAASRVSDAVRSQHPEVPWAEIVGMRNRLVHAYFEVDLERVCDTLALDLPPLIVQLEKMLAG
jgi:uncharacterized protein with HEPN domain